MSAMLPDAWPKPVGTALWASRLAAYIPALMLAYGLVIWPVIYGRSPDTGPAFETLQTESSALSQVYFPALFLVTAFVWIATSYGRRAPIASGTIAILAALLGLAVASVAWSIAPDIALRRVILQAAIVCTLVLSVQAAADPKAVLDRIFWTLAGIMALNLAVVAVTRPGPLGYEGVYPQKNGLGAAAALAILFGLHQLFCGRPVARVAAAATIGVAMLLLVLSRSKTSFGLALIAPFLAIGIAVAARATAISAAVIVTSLVAVLLGIYWLGVASNVWDFPTVMEAVFGDPTLTTRTDIWSFALTMIERKPLLGFGFESFWQSPESPSLREAPGFVAKMPHAHNGYIDITLQLGLVGLAVLVALILGALHAVSGTLRRGFGLGWLCLTLALYASFVNVFESAWFRGFDFISMTFVIVIALAASLREDATWRS